MEVLERRPAVCFAAHKPKPAEARMWDGRASDCATRAVPLETTRRWYGAMLTTCPNCLHVFDQPLSSSCCASRASAAPGAAAPPSQPPLSDAAPAPAPAAQPPPQPQPQAPPPPLLLSATLQLQAGTGLGTVPSTCTLAVATGAAAAPLRALAAMAGGGIVLQQQQPQQPEAGKPSGSTPGTTPSPQPSPSAPLSFVLPTVPGTPRPIGPAAHVPFQWSPLTTIAPTSLQVNVHVPIPSVIPTTTALPQVPQSETDLERLAATLGSLRASGWYYEGLSWQESADALQATRPGTFLVRDSSDPRFLFSLSVQTDRGPTSIRLHYVCGSFRLDAEPRLAPFMPLFDCVVKLVEYYVELTRNRNTNSQPKLHRDKEQVWVDARGQMYSHILLRSPLYKKQQLPSLQHLSRLAINRQVKATGRAVSVSALHLPLPAPLQTYVREYPYIY